MVSPYIKKGTIVSDVYDHTSIIRTVCKRWQLHYLTERDRKAKNFEGVLNSPTARTDFPEIKPRPYNIPERAREEPINDLQKALLYVMAGFDDALQIERDESILQKAEDLLQLVEDEGRIAHIKTVGGAVDFMKDFENRPEKHLSFKAILRWLWKKINGLFG